MKFAQSCLTLYRPHGLYGPWNSPVENTGADSLFLLQRIFPIQELNWDLLHCREILTNNAVREAQPKDMD